MLALRRGRKRRTGAWTRKGMPKRSKEMWHIPKRKNIEQMRRVIEILLDPQLSFNGKAWTKGRKETFNTELAKRGFTESGAPLSPSGLRTLEALLKYFGLIFYIEPIIQVTDAGRYFVNNPREAFTLQMLKLQITNPVIIRDCIGIQVFPFRTTLRLLLDNRLNGFLSSEELGYIIFMRMKHESDYEKVVNDIRSFRNSSPQTRKRELTTFKKSPEGQVTLVKAPSVKYYMSFCVYTGLCRQLENRLEISPGMEKTVEDLLVKFKGIEPYNFGKNMHLWMQYFGDPKRLAPPRDITIRFV